MLAVLLATVLAAPPTVVVRPQERTAYKALLDQKALSADTAFAGSPCPNATVQDLATQQVAIAGHPDAPALREKLQVSGCGRTTTQNVYVARAGGSPPWRMANAMPGDSLADVNLQPTIWTEALKQARVDLPSDCLGQRLEDIYVTARPGHVTLRAPTQAEPPDRPGWFTVTLPQQLEKQTANLDVTQAWVEIWPISVCGQNRTMAVVFIPERDRAHVAYGFVAVWRTVEARGALALPQPAPADQANSGPDVPTAAIPAS